jgi:hypothetical protein
MDEEKAPANDAGLYSDDSFAEMLRLSRHPIVKHLRSLLTVDLSSDLNLLFERTAAASHAGIAGTPFAEIRQQRGERGEEEVRRMVDLMNMGVQEGLRSATYHLGRLRELEGEVKLRGQELMQTVRPKKPMSLGLPSQALTSEYEAFTLMSRATLDRLCSFYRAYFKANARNLYRLKTELANNRAADARARRLIEAIDRHAEYLDTQISMDKLRRKTDRDRLAHDAYVSFTTMNIIGGPDGLVQVIAVTGTPDGRMMEDPVFDLADRFEKLKAAVIDLVSSFFDWDELLPIIDAFIEARKDFVRQEKSKIESGALWDRLNQSAQMKGLDNPSRPRDRGRNH